MVRSIEKGWGAIVVWCVVLKKDGGAIVVWCVVLKKDGVLLSYGA